MRAAETSPSSHEIRPKAAGGKKKSSGMVRLVTVIGVSLMFFGATRPSALCQTADPRHEEHAWHLGFLAGAVYNLHEKSTGLGLGFEYERLLPVGDSSLGIGVAGEMVFDEHKHYVISLLMCFHPVKPLTLSVAPGILFLDRGGFESRAAIHFGLEYEFEVGRTFLAPEAEIAFAGEDVHLMLGLHLGFGF